MMLLMHRMGLTTFGSVKREPEKNTGKKTRKTKKHKIA